jgi:selenide,water dikinase
VATAVKRGIADPETGALAVAIMKRLNRPEAEAMADVGVHACTDVTGFGLLGHLREMASASGVDAELNGADVPVVKGVRELAAADAIPGGTVDNLDHVSRYIDWGEGVSRVQKLILADAQTSGGLLIAVSPDLAEPLLEGLGERGVEGSRIIGRFVEEGAGRIRVTW